MATAHRCPGRLFAQQQPPLAHGSLQGSVVLRIDPLQGGAQHPDRRSIPLQATGVDRSIDPFRQSADHRPARFGEGLAEGAGHAQAMGGGPPGAHHRHGPAPGHQALEGTPPLPPQGERRPGEAFDADRPMGIPGQHHPQPWLCARWLSAQGVIAPALAKPLHHRHQAAVPTG